MSPDPSVEPSEPVDSGEADWERQRRLDAIFGDVTPSSTRDDRDDPAEQRNGSREAWLQAQVPPHHGN